MFAMAATAPRSVKVAEGPLWNSWQFDPEIHPESIAILPAT